MLTGWRADKPWLRRCASVPQQQTNRDFAKSRTKALADIAEGLPPRQRAGMPRFKKRELADPTLNYTRRGFRLRDGRLHLAGGIAVTVVWSRDLPAEAKLAAKTHGKVARRRRDDARKWAKKVARDFDAVAVEDFRPTFLAKSTMARKAADAAIGVTKQALIEMGRKHGRDVRLVDPAYTTMDCGECGARAKHRLPLSERIYTCTACGTSRPRDRNSARVMLVRAGLDPGGADGRRPPAPPGREAA